MSRDSDGKCRTIQLIIWSNFNVLVVVVVFFCGLFPLPSLYFANIHKHMWKEIIFVLKNAILRRVSMTRVFFVYQSLYYYFTFGTKFKLNTLYNYWIIFLLLINFEFKSIYKFLFFSEKKTKSNRFDFVSALLSWSQNKTRNLNDPKVIICVSRKSFNCKKNLIDI